MTSGALVFQKSIRLRFSPALDGALKDHRFLVVTSPEPRRSPLIESSKDMNDFNRMEMALLVT